MAAQRDDEPTNRLLTNKRGWLVDQDNGLDEQDDDNDDVRSISGGMNLVLGDAISRHDRNWINPIYTTVQLTYCIKGPRKRKEENA